MALVALNRILIVLGYVGLFISGFLSLSHLLNISLPCGVSRGCDIVATHPTAFLNGSSDGIPVAYLGFAGYLFLTIIAIARGVKGVAKTRPLLVAGFVASAVGALYSGYLTYTALYVIHATCLWCLASAITMILTTLVYAAALQANVNTDEAPSKTDPMIAGIMALVVGIGMAGGTVYLKNSGEKLSGKMIDTIVKDKIDLIGPNAHTLGNPDAPVTIIEFADMMCPTCQQTYPVLEDLVHKSNGKVRLVFHHFPLFMKEDHKMALPAAVIAEMAAEEQKFWIFISAFYSKQSTDLQTIDSVLAVAASVGMNPEKIRKRLDDQNDPALKRVTDDLNLANKIKINGTPTILLQTKDKLESVVPSQLENKLNTEPYKSLILGGGSGS